VLNASDEVAVEAFLAGRIPFTGIPEVIERTREAIPGGPVRHFEDLFDVDRAARDHARGVIEGLTVA
jgi:1-deoxy-D-xylulose-5-phosphate reductoisomerase